MYYPKTLLLCLAIPLAATGCTTMEAQIRSSGSMGSSDAEYVDTAYQLVQMDDQAGKLATAKASDPRVKTLAANIMAQADALSPSLVSALNVEGVQPPKTLPREEAAKLAALNTASDSAFDRQYVEDELAIHKRAVSVMQKDDAATKDGALRTQIESELPAVQANLSSLQVLSDEYHGKTQS